MVRGSLTATTSKLLRVRVRSVLHGTEVGGVHVRFVLDDLSLFTGSAARAYRFASEELLEHWEKYPRLSLAAFEARWLQGVPAWA